jgi:hypothetical protein
MKTISFHFERLRRHYELAVRSYDTVALLDLSHSLRIWAELKSELPKLVPSFGRTQAFKTETPSKKVLRASKGSRFVFAYMPGGVVTYCAKDQLASGPELDVPTEDLTVGISVQWAADQLLLRNFCFVSRAIEDVPSNVLASGRVARCNYIGWLGAEVVRVSFVNEGVLSVVAISRETMIKRVANALDGSHASLANRQSDKRFDPAVRHLLEYRVGGLALPYFILLKTAQDILSIGSKLLGSTRMAVAAT